MLCRSKELKKVKNHSLSIKNAFKVSCSIKHGRSLLPFSYSVAVFIYLINTSAEAAFLAGKKRRY
jgi:hypothetical protein